MVKLSQQDLLSLGEEKMRLEWEGMLEKNEIPLPLCKWLPCKGLAELCSIFLLTKVRLKD